MYKKYLALDIGDVRIGVAKSDLLGIVASPVETIDRKKTKPVKRILELCDQEQTQSIVVGIPKSLDGTEKRQAEKVRTFVQSLKASRPSLEIFEVDERMTTVMADQALTEMKKKGALEKRKFVDQVAASLILQQFLNMKK